MSSLSRTHFRGHRSRSGFVWMGLIATCLVFCAKGLCAETKTGGKSEGRAVSNAPIVAESGRERPFLRRSLIDHDEPAMETSDDGDGGPAALPGGFQPEQLVSPGGLGSTINMMVVLTVLSLAPSILIMTTCFIRFVVVLGLLRQALGTQQLPPNQVMMALCLFLTFLVMSPVWQQSYDEGIKPYTEADPDQPPPTLTEAFTKTARPIREFMIKQIEKAGNTDTVWMFLEYQRAKIDAGTDDERPLASRYGEVPLTTLMSAYMLSELKVAFVIGFQVFLPFLVIDVVVATVLTSMGMMMLPPTLVSFPFKLLLFVLIDGWALTVGMLLESVRSG